MWRGFGVNGLLGHNPPKNTFPRRFASFSFACFVHFLPDGLDLVFFNGWALWWFLGGLWCFRRVAVGEMVPDAFDRSKAGE